MNIEKQPDVGCRTCLLCDAAVPVVKGAAQHSVFARLQHDVTAHKPPHRAPAVSQQATQRQRTGAVVRDPKHQHTQVQQVALCCVPSPEDTRGKVQLKHPSLRNHSDSSLLSHAFDRTATKLNT